MFIELNYRSGKAAYIQIAEQVKYAAASGSLLPGDPLPGIRPLAERLEVNRNTVAKAYSELEKEGIVEIITGIGCIISKSNSPLKKSVRNKLLEEAVDAALVQAHHLQASEEEFLNIVTKRMKTFSKRNLQAKSESKK